METFIKKDNQYIAHTYGRFPICIERGEGTCVFDIKGKKYIDFTSGIGVNSLGYGDREWTEAVSQQAGELAHMSNLYYTKPMLSLAEKLCKKSGMKKVFFSNSGAEANEGAIKAARKYGNTKYHGRRNEIITFINSFHGRTMTTLAATGQEMFHQNFQPFPEGFTYTAANDFPGFCEKVCERTAAVMLEIVQGEGGVIALDEKFLLAVQRVCDENDILLIIDEVQTGIGRTGKLFAYEHYGLHPDIITAAKGLGGGLPIGAVLLGEKLEQIFKPGDHGSTFGGNLVACAGANVVMDRLTPEFLVEIEEKGAYLKERLLKMPKVKSVSGLGMMLGAELEGIPGKEVANACIPKGALFLTAKEKLRLLPPLTMGYEEMKKGMDILENVLKKC